MTDLMEEVHRLREQLATVTKNLISETDDHDKTYQQLADAEKTMADAWVSMGDKVKRIEEVKAERDQLAHQLAEMTRERDEAVRIAKGLHEAVTSSIMWR